VSRARAQAMETLSKAAVKNWRIGNNQFYFNLVEKAMPQIFQSSEKRKQSESTNEIRSYLRQLRSFKKFI